MLKFPGGGVALKSYCVDLMSPKFTAMSYLGGETNH